MQNLTTDEARKLIVKEAAYWLDVFNENEYAEDLLQENNWKADGIIKENKEIFLKFTNPKPNVSAIIKSNEETSCTVIFYIDGHRIPKAEEIVFCDIIDSTYSEIYIFATLKSSYFKEHDCHYTGYSQDSEFLQSKHLQETALYDAKFELLIEAAGYKCIGPVIKNIIGINTNDNDFGKYYFDDIDALKTAKETLIKAGCKYSKKFKTKYIKNDSDEFDY